MLVSGQALPTNAGTIVDRLGRLFTALGGVNLPASPTQSAAVQLAVWESIYEGHGTLSVSSGDGLFSASAAPAAVVTTANALLASAAALTHSLYSISVLRNATRQDFVLLQRVPEPATLLLVASALTALAWAWRRRRSGARPATAAVGPGSGEGLAP